MDIRFLTTFIEVVNTRHFGKAAENLYLTQSAVSARIKLLEEYFHTSLFVRNRNSIQLTPAGEQLLPYAQQLCATLNDARQALQQQAGEYIVCGATQLAGELALHDFVSDLCTSFPDYAIKAEVYSLDQVTRKLHERAVDIAFSSEPLKSEEVVCTELFNWPLGLYGSSADIEMTPDHYIAIDWGNKAREALLAMYPECRDAHFRTNSLQLALHTHRREGGVMILPIELANQLAPDAHLLVPLNNASTSVYLSYMKSIRRGELNDIVAHLTRRTHE